MSFSEMNVRMNRANWEAVRGGVVILSGLCLAMLWQSRDIFWAQISITQTGRTLVLAAVHSLLCHVFNDGVARGFDIG